MNTRQWGLSVFFVAFAVLKVAELAVPLENWPASNVSMFSGYRPRQFVPLRSRLEVVRESGPGELTHWDLALSRDEFQARMHPDSRVAIRCAMMVESYNREQTNPDRRILSAKVVVEPVSRPGLWNDYTSRTVPCGPPSAPPPLPRTRP